MSYNSDKDVQNRIDEHYEIITHIEKRPVIGVFLHGSQNYGLGTDQSDVDSKAICLPTFEEIVSNTKPVSYTHICENNEHIDVKDIRLYLNLLRRQNTNYVETLFTKFKHLNPRYEFITERLLEGREEIARYSIKDTLNAMMGMCYEKRKALDHRYEGLIEKIDKFGGYDPKQLHHIMRLEDMMERYIDGEPYADCLLASTPNELIKVKLEGVQDLKTAIELADNGVDYTKYMRNKWLEDTPVTDINEEVDRQLNDIARAYLKFHFMSEWQDDMSIFGQKLYNKDTFGGRL